MPIGICFTFFFSSKQLRAGIGIMIIGEERGKGFASEALDLIVEYAFDRLKLHQLYANVLEENEASLALFKRKHFEIIGVKKEWIRHKDDWKDETILQRLNANH